jgi:hypothetical protein
MREKKLQSDKKAMPGYDAERAEYAQRKGDVSLSAPSLRSLRLG